MVRMLAIALLIVMPGLAFAQSKTAPRPNGPETRYFTAIDGLLDNMADVVLKETRQGKTVNAATLDVCYPAGLTTPRKDRFVVNLAINGTALSGTAKSVVDQTPISVQLTQKPNGDTFDFKGQVTIGTATSNVSSNDNTDVSESDYLDTQTTDDGIVAAPKDFSEVSPESIALKVKLEAAPELFKALRGQSIEISPSSFVVSCDALRSGSQLVSLAVDPDRAAALIARVKTMPGVTGIGWSSGVIEMERSVRFNAAAWRDGDHVARDKIAAALAGALEGPLQAKFAAAKWSDTTGKLTLTLKRRSQLFPTLDLTDTLEVTALAAPDRPGSTDKMMLWVSIPTFGLIDESTGAPFTLSDGPLTSGEDSDPRADAAIIDSVARAFKAQRWDADKAAWK